ncbi:MAG: hypothetical protein AAF654_11485 [Myxococcota bacterium]
MDRLVANDRVRGALAAVGIQSQGLNAKGFGGAQLGAAEIYFEHGGQSLNATAIRVVGEQPLGVYARIYTFRRPPSDAVLKALERAESDPETPSGGGELVYMEENSGLYLGRVYSDPPDSQALAEDLVELARASLHWLENTLEQCLAEAE